MKRLLILFLIFAVSVLPLFSDDQLTGKKKESNSFTINAHYTSNVPVNSQTIVLRITDASNERVYHAGRITTEQGLGVTAAIFNWNLESNYTSAVTITFTLTALQAYSGGIYYVPAHKFLTKLTQPNLGQNSDKTVAMFTLDTNTSSLPDESQIIEEYTVLLPFANANYGDRQYPGYMIASVVNNRTVITDNSKVTAVYSCSGVQLGGGINYWVAEGQFALIVDSVKQGSLSLSYVSNVTVGVTVT